MPGSTFNNITKLGVQIGGKDASASNPVPILNDSYTRDPLGALNAEKKVAWWLLTAAYALDTDSTFFGSSGGGTAAARDVTTGQVKLLLPATTSGDSSYMVANYPAITHPGVAVRIQLSVQVPSALLSNQQFEFGGTTGTGTSVITTDSIGFFMTATATGVFYRSTTSGSAVTSTVTSSNWNVDKLDGLGPSGVTANWTKGHVYRIDVDTLGYGVANFFVDGILVHKLSFANSLTTPAIYADGLRGYAYLWNTGTAGSTGTSAFVRSGSVHTIGGDYTFREISASNLSTRTLPGSGSAPVPIIVHEMASTLGGAPNNHIAFPRSTVLIATVSSYIDVWIGSASDFTGWTGLSPSVPSNSPGSGSLIDLVATAVTVGAGARRIQRTFNVGSTSPASFNFASQNGNNFPWSPYAHRASLRGDGTSTFMVVTIVAISATPGTVAVPIYLADETL